MRNATAVTLSSPPASLAARTRRRTPSTSGPSSSRFAIAWSPTSPERPSEQSSRTSPSRTWTTLVSTSSSGPAPSARVITERCGCTAASSRVRRPARSSSATSEWSCDSCCSTPSRRRYARESPTWPSTTRSPSTSAAVTVEPMPAVAGSFLARSRTRRFDSRMVRRRRSSPRLALARAELAEGVDREARRELARTRAAHAVGDDEERRLIEERVLVRPAHLAGVARARVVDDAHGHHSSYLSSVSPTRTSSPTRRRCSATSACPATCVPFVEPRSST